MAGIFVVIEGIDAAGKGTQSELLAERLKAKLFTIPRYSTSVGRLIDGYLKEEWCTADRPVAGPTHPGLARNNVIGSYVFQSLMIMNRYEVAPEILEHRRKGTSVVCDRFNESAVVYGTVDGINPEYTHLLGAQLPVPDVQVLVDIPVAEMLRRRPQGRDRHETNIPFMEKVVAAYREEWKRQQVKNPTGWPIVDGVGTIEEVHQRICAVVAHAKVSAHPAAT